MVHQPLAWDRETAMEVPAPHTRLRWLVTGIVLLAGALLLLYLRREAITPDPAVLLPGDPAPGPAPASTSGGDAPIGVDVVGAVAQPGLYFFQEGARVDDAVKAAGGFAPDADRDAVNLANRLHDEQQLRIPRAGDGSSTLSGTNTPMEVAVEEATAAGDVSPPAGLTPAAGKLDLNTADAEALAGLPGIGPVMAQRIVEYRTANGPFQSVEQLQDVNGIGDATFDEVRDYVVVTP